MKKITGLTAVILVQNEARILPRCLESLAFVGQILVIDDFSTDGSAALARRAGAKVIRHRLTTFAAQRNFALQKVTTPWVLMIDADEEVPPPLAQEIARAVSQSKFAGFRFPRRNFIFGRPLRATGWWPDYQLHLFQTKLGRYENPVHEQVVLSGSVGELSTPLLHQNFRDLGHYLSQRKFCLYSCLAADQLVAQGYVFSWPDLLNKPAAEFFRRFFVEKGYRDGVLGLALSLLQAFKELVIYLLIWENQGYPEVKDQSLLPLFKKETARLGREFRFWLLTTGLMTEKNWLKKLLKRFARFFCR